MSDRWEKLEVSNVSGGPRGLGMVSLMMAGEGGGWGNRTGDGSVRATATSMFHADCCEL